MAGSDDAVTSTLTRKGAEVRARIVVAAAKVIFERGVGGTTIDDVKTAASVSSSQLYHYFMDKDALVRAVIAHQADTILRRQENARFDSVDGFRAWRDRVVETVRSNDCRGGCPLGSLGSQLAESDPGARDDVAHSFARWEDALRDGLLAMRAGGRLAPEADPESLALAMLTTLQGGLLLSQIQRDTKPLEAALDFMIDLIERQSVRT